jgi:hypothetical protein
VTKGRTLSMLASLALALVTVCTASANTRASLNGPSTLTFTDPAGDASGAADLTNVVVSGDASTGTISFTVTASGLEPAVADGSDRAVEILLNTDRNNATGSASGNEFELYFWNNSTDPANASWDIERWNGSAYEEVALSPTMHAGRNGDQFAFQINTTDLGGATSFSLFAATETFDANGDPLGHDVAPDGSLRWVYSIAGPTQTMTTFLTPVIGKPLVVPSQLKAGKRVTVSFPVTGSQAGKTSPLTSGKMVCDPSLAGKVITHQESFRNGLARLSFLVPKTAKGKTLKVKLTITAPSSQAADSVWLNIATGEQGITGNFVKGFPATKVTSFRVH